MIKKFFHDIRGMAVTTIIALTILILGFVVLLFFYTQVDWSGNIDRTICHQSVVYRATLPGFANSKELVPLKCQTQKICITSSFFGKCDEFDGANGVTKVSVSDLEDLEQYISQEVLGCWETMGRGELSLFAGGILLDQYSIGDVQSSCVVCSRIAFDDDSLSKSGINRDEMDLFRYMATHKVPGEDISYYEKILGSKGRLALDGEKRTAENVNTFLAKDSLDNGDSFIFSEPQSNEMAVLFMQVTSPEWDDIVASDLALLGVGVVTNNAIGSFIPKIFSGGIVGSVVQGISKRALIIAAIAGVAVQTYNYYENRGITASYCGDISVGGESRSGCSVVRTTNYNVNDLSQICGKIESIS